VADCLPQVLDAPMPFPSASQGVRQNCMTNKFCVSPTVGIFYAVELYDNAVWPGWRLRPGSSSQHWLHPIWLGEVLIFINAAHMQSWQFVKASREFPEAFSARYVNGKKHFLNNRETSSLKLSIL